MRLFTEHDELTGLTKEYRLEAGKLIEHSTQDVSPLLDLASQARNDPEYARAGIRADLQHVAHIPAVVVLKWINEYGFDATTAHPREILRFIEARPEFHYLKMTTGEVAR